MNSENQKEQVVSESVAQLQSGVVAEDTESDNEPYPGSTTTVLKQQLTKTTMLPFKDHKFGTNFTKKHLNWKK